MTHASALTATITTPSITSSTMAIAAQLSDRDLLAATTRVASAARRTTAELLALLAELDTRKLYLGEGCASLFTYCTQRLRLSEAAAYSRITAARAARRYPTLFARLAEGEVTLTTISLLAAHLTDDNHDALLDAARLASRRDVERLVASLHAQPDIPSRVRRIPSEEPSREHSLLTASSPVQAGLAPPAPQVTSPPPATARPAVAALAADRYLLRVTISASTHAKLDRARDLLRHAIPGGDLARVVDRALTLLVDQLERRRTGRASRPARAQPRPAAARRRHIPAAVKRLVWNRDQGRCAFAGSAGRCGETGFLEYHHVVPFATGGPTEAANLELRCRAHNAYEATLYFDDERPRTSRRPQPDDDSVRIE